MSEQINGTRVEEQRVKKMRNLLNMTRIFAAAIFIAGFALVLSSIDTSIWNAQSFWFGLKFFVFVFELLFLLIGYGIAYLLGYDDSGAIALMSGIHTAIFGGNDTILGISVEDLLTNPLQIPEQQSVTNGVYTFFIIISLIVSLIAGLGFLRDCNPGLSAVSFFGMNIVLGLASISGKLLIDLNFDSSNIIEMVFSKLVITAFLIYFYLELSFQASYIYNVISPNIHRQRRISANINRLKEFEIPVLQEKKVKENGETDRMMVIGKNTSTSRLTVTTAFSRVRGLLGKKLFKISTEEDWDKMNSRLKTFYSKLEENDPFISVSLSASAYTPSIMRLMILISTGTILRMGALLLLSWLALNPVPILQILNMPESIINSVEAGQPEMVMFVLAPLAVLFMLIGLIVQSIQRRIARRMELRTTGRVIHPITRKSKVKSVKKTA